MTTYHKRLLRYVDSPTELSSRSLKVADSCM